jgi:hypothetical protein
MGKETAIQIRFPENLWKTLQKRAKKAHRSLNAEVLLCLEEYFDHANLMDYISKKTIEEIESLAAKETDGNFSKMMAILISEAVEEKLSGNVTTGSENAK